MSNEPLSDRIKNKRSVVALSVLGAATALVLAVVSSYEKLSTLLRPSQLTATVHYTKARVPAGLVSWGTEGDLKGVAADFREGRSATVDELADYAHIEGLYVVRIKNSTSLTFSRVRVKDLPYASFVDVSRPNAVRVHIKLNARAHEAVELGEVLPDDEAELAIWTPIQGDLGDSIRVVTESGAVSPDVLIPSHPTPWWHPVAISYAVIGIMLQFLMWFGPWSRIKSIASTDSGGLDIKLQQGPPAP
jgi:hypothetical protein